MERLLVLLRSELMPFFTMIVMWSVGVEGVRLGMASDVRRWRCLGTVDTRISWPFLICGSFQAQSTTLTFESLRDRSTALIVTRCRIAA